MTNNEAGLGHNHQLEVAAERGLAAMQDYKTGRAKEQAGREEAIAALVRYGEALSVGRDLHGDDNNAFHDWIIATGLDQVKPFHDRQERSAAQQMAKIVAEYAAAALTGPPVNPFAGCGNSRPTDIMAWWRIEQETKARFSDDPLIGETAKEVTKRQTEQRVKREEERKADEERKAAAWAQWEAQIEIPPVERTAPAGGWPELTQAYADTIRERAERATRYDLHKHINVGDENALDQLKSRFKDTFEALSEDRSIEAVLVHVEAKLKLTPPTPTPAAPKVSAQPVRSAPDLKNDAFDRGDPDRKWPSLTKAHAKDIAKRAAVVLDRLDIDDEGDREDLIALTKEPLSTLRDDRSTEGLLETIESHLEEIDEEDEAEPAPVSGYVYDAVVEIANNDLALIRAAGLSTINEDDHKKLATKLVIKDRAKAVAWFADALVAYDEAHPDEAPAAPEPKPAKPTPDDTVH